MLINSIAGNWLKSDNLEKKLSLLVELSILALASAKIDFLSPISKRLLSRQNSSKNILHPNLN